eukprot:Phypoly_transcript_17733.p1 GENE.Phypoly_transcript_17733~~Phypoly_transcript_17733.p1  ORF type:complete len:233 (+),score=56.38 Phypoly_transcript_17733:76-774(+)
MSATLFFSEELVSSLEAFSTQQEKVVSPELLKIVENISKTGVVCYSWSTLKTLLSHLLGQTLKNYTAKIADKESLKGDDEGNDIEKRSQRFLYALDSFDEAPFTVQRLCELILAPEKVYSTYFKYVSALEKMVNITSTLPTLTPQQIQTINQTGLISPQPEDDSSSSSAPSPSSSHTFSSAPEENYPTSMNVDLNGVQTTFPHQVSATSSEDDKDNVNLAAQEEKPPTPMDM